MKIQLPPLHPAQIEVQTNPARYKVVSAGRRWGKGILGVGECVRRSALGQRCWWIPPTFASAAYQAGWRIVEFYHSQIPSSTIHYQRRRLDVGTGWLQFRTAEEPDSLRGEGIDFAVVDEAAHIPKLREIWELSLRATLLDRRGSAWFVSTPYGHNYFAELFRRGERHEAGWASFRFPTHANPYLDPAEIEELALDMPALVRRQEIEAELVQLGGALFQRDWIVYLDVEPSVGRWCRSWDLAFTTKTTSHYTVGAKVGLRSDGTCVVAHVVRGRWEWPEAVQIVRETALADGPAVAQGVECVGAQRGFLQTLLREPLLANIILQPLEVPNDKVTRALPLLVRGEQRKLAFVRGDWNGQALDELCEFPEGTYDDVVDALSGGVTYLAQRKVRVGGIPGMVVRSAR